MKHIFAKICLIALLAIPATQKASANYRICLVDNCKYFWSVEFTPTAKGYSFAGTVDVGSGPLWSVKGWMDQSNDSIEATLVNPNMDGCKSGMADSIMYCGHGCGFHDQNKGGDPVFMGTGNWVSFCKGKVQSKGLFSIKDCNHEDHWISDHGLLPAQAPIALENAVNLKASPNPVTTSTTISYNVAKEGKVNITVYNNLQQPVKTIVNETKTAGSHSAMWDGRNANGSQATSGIYKVVAVVNGKSTSTSVQVIH